jgi:hypothetical protein
VLAHRSSILAVRPNSATGSAKSDTSLKRKRRNVDPRFPSRAPGSDFRRRTTAPSRRRSSRTFPWAISFARASGFCTRCLPAQA